jgi:predicted nucleotidyltransferase
VDDPKVVKASVDSVDQSSPTLERMLSLRDVNYRLATISRIGSVAVFGSVAVGTATSVSDIDLLVEPRADASLFDLTQFGIDMEQLLGRPVDVLSRRSLDPAFDKQILAEAIPL